MTLVVTVYSPTGIAISADSRTTGTRQEQVVASPAQPPINITIPWVVSDNTRKVFSIQDRYGVATWGEAFINGLPIAHHMSEFLAKSITAPITKTSDLADALRTYFGALISPGPLGFSVAGYDQTEPCVYEVSAFGTSYVKRWNWDAAANTVQYGAFYGGDWDIVARLLDKAQIAWQFMNVQDAVDISRHLIRASIDQMKYEARSPTIGGPIDTITVTPNRAKFLVRKELRT